MSVRVCVSVVVSMSKEHVQHSESTYSRVVIRPDGASISNLSNITRFTFGEQSGNIGLLSLLVFTPGVSLSSGVLVYLLI